MKILMVCLGNICRSPLAEGILQEKIRERGLAWEVESAGTGDWHIGEPPDPRSIAIARRYGIDISRQRARQFERADFEHFDLIFTMDATNYRDVLRHAPSAAHHEKVDLIMNLVYPQENRSVPDPYWDDEGFEQVFDMLDRATERLLEQYE